MDYQNKTLLEEEISRLFKELSDVEPGSDEYKATMNETVKLIDRLNESQRIENEYEEKVESRKRDNELKAIQMENDRKDRLISHVISGAGIVIPVIVTIWGTVVSLKFEETGSVTTIMGRGFINKLLPKK